MRCPARPRSSCRPADCAAPEPARDRAAAAPALGGRSRRETGTRRRGIPGRPRPQIGRERPIPRTTWSGLRRVPDRRTFLIGEIIHTPDVNARLQQMGIVILADAKDPVVRYAQIESRDVVILPAFGVPIADMAPLTEKGCVLVDTTCGSVLN